MATEENVPKCPVEEAPADIASPEGPPPSPIRLEVLETYRGIPIYHLSYAVRTVYDRVRHEEELRALGAIPEGRFGLVTCLRNLALSAAYSPEEQTVASGAPEHAPVRERLVSSARYSPDSLSMLIRSMSLNLYLKQAAGMAPDRETALKAVRRGIDARLGK
jgi:hypothetical protein